MLASSTRTISQGRFLEKIRKGIRDVMGQGSSLSGVRPDQFVDEGLDVVGLVEERDDDGDFSGHCWEDMGFPCGG